MPCCGRWFAAEGLLVCCLIGLEDFCCLIFLSTKSQSANPVRSERRRLLPPRFGVSDTSSEQLVGALQTEGTDLRGVVAELRRDGDAPGGGVDMFKGEMSTSYYAAVQLALVAENSTTLPRHQGSARRPCGSNCIRQYGEIFNDEKPDS